MYVTDFLQSGFINRLRHWGIKGGLAIIDQGLFSGSNFILNVLLARWLSPSEYGAFSISFAIYLFFSGFHNALILEPISVLGTARYANSIKSYLSSQIYIHFIVSGLSSLIILVGGVVLYLFHVVDKNLFLYIVGLGLFLPFMLLIWLARRSCYVSSQSGRAVGVSLVYVVFLFVGVALVHLNDSFTSPLFWYFVIGVASLIGSSVVYINFDMIEYHSMDWQLLFQEQWRFGKWIMLATVLYTLGVQIQVFVVAAKLGLDSAGSFRAIQNFVLPMMQALVAISTLALPSISREFGMSNYVAVRSKAIRVGVGLTVISLFYFVILLFFSVPIEGLLYAGKFTDYIPLIKIVGIVPVITSVEIAYSLIARSLQRPAYHAVYTGWMAITGVCVSFVFIEYWGVLGAILALISVSFVSLIVNIWFYKKWFDHLLY